MSEEGGPRRSTRIANKRQTTGGDENKPKRMKSDPSSRALTSLDERLRDVFSFRAAIPLIDDDDPAFLFDWQMDNVIAFVAAANGSNPAQAPPWLRTCPQQLIHRRCSLQIVHPSLPLAGGRCGHIMQAPNTLQQFLTIGKTLGSLENNAFLQNAAQVALPVFNNVEPYLTNPCLAASLLRRDLPWRNQIWQSFHFTTYD